MMLALIAAAALGVTDTEGRRVDPFATPARAHVFVFMHPDCPVSNRYVPEVNRLHATYAAQNVRIWVIYPGREDDVDAIRTHVAEYGLQPPALRDPEFELADAAGATMTPEAAVFVAGRQLVYRGRINDRAVRLGLIRPAPRTRDLAGVLDRVIRGEQVERFTTQAVGCYIK